MFARIVSKLLRSADPRFASLCMLTQNCYLVVVYTHIKSVIKTAEVSYLKLLSDDRHTQVNGGNIGCVV